MTIQQCNGCKFCIKKGRDSGCSALEWDPRAGKFWLAPVKTCPYWVNQQQKPWKERT